MICWLVQYAAQICKLSRPVQPSQFASLVCPTQNLGFKAWPATSLQRKAGAHRQVGLTNRARARAMRILQPPEKSLVRLACISFVKPKPCRILAALASVVAASSCSSLFQNSTFSINQDEEFTQLFKLSKKPIHTGPRTWERFFGRKFASATVNSYPSKASFVQ